MKKVEKPSKLNPVETRKTSATDTTNKDPKMKSLSIAVNKNPQANGTVAIKPEPPVKADDVMILLDRFKVETEFFELVESEFSEIYPYLLENVEYSPQDLIGEPLWNDLISLAQRQAIFCLKHLATLPDAPLVDVTCSDCGTSSFQIV